MRFAIIDLDVTTGNCRDGLADLTLLCLRLINNVASDNTNPPTLMIAEKAEE